jgi:hypothetical protein
VSAESIPSSKCKARHVCGLFCFALIVGVRYAMLIAGNLVIIAGILIAFLAATFLAALLLTYLCGVMSLGPVIAT